MVLFALFIVHEARTPHPMLPLGLFRRRNFAVGNLETLLMYGGLSAVIFFLVLFLQQVAGYEALQAGLATLPITIVTFALARRAGRMADRYRPALVHGRAARWSPRRASRCSSASTPTSTTSPTSCPRCCSSRSGCRPPWRR